MREHHIDCECINAQTTMPSGEGVLIVAGDPSIDWERNICTCTAFDHECPEPEMKNIKNRCQQWGIPGIPELPETCI